MIAVSDILIVSLKQTLFTLLYIGLIWTVVLATEPFLLPRVTLAKGALANHQLMRGLPIEILLVAQRTFLVGRVNLWQWALIGLLTLQIQLVLFAEWFAREMPSTILVFLLIYLGTLVVVALREHYDCAHNGILANNVRMGTAVFAIIWISFAAMMWSGRNHIHEMSSHILPAVRSPALALILANCLVLTPFFTFVEKPSRASKLDEFIIFLSQVAWFTWLGALFVGNLSLTGLGEPLIRALQVVTAILLVRFGYYFLPQLRADSLTRKLLWVNIPLFIVSCLSIFWRA